MVNHPSAEYPGARSYPFSYEVSVLEREVELRVLRRIARALGFTTEIVKGVRGLSGIVHDEVLLGKRAKGRHVIIFQSGFEKCLSTKLSPRLKALRTPSIDHDPRPLDVREEESRREVLFSAYDLKASLESDGWTCDVLYFLNMQSPEEHGFSLPRQLKQVLGPSLGDVRIQSQRFGSTGPIKTIPVSDIAQSALATGSGLIKLSDFTMEELIELAGRRVPREDPSSVNTMLRRMNVAQYFNPPIDELMLGAMGETELDWSERELVLSGEVSETLEHAPSDPELVPQLDLENPLAVIAALKNEHFIDYEGEITRLTQRGDKVVHRFKTTNRQSWNKKIAEYVDLIKKLTGLGGLLG